MKFTIDVSKRSRKVKRVKRKPKRKRKNDLSEEEEIITAMLMNMAAKRPKRYSRKRKGVSAAGFNRVDGTGTHYRSKVPLNADEAQQALDAGMLDVSEVPRANKRDIDDVEDVQSQGSL